MDDLSPEQEALIDQMADMSAKLCRSVIRKQIRAIVTEVKPLKENADEMARLLRFVLAKGDKPMWLSDGWRADAEAVIRAHSAEGKP